MALTSKVLGTRRQQGDLVFVVCEYTHVDARVVITKTLGFPIGIDVDQACADLSVVMEIFFANQERDTTASKVLNEGAMRSDIAGNTIFLTDDEAFSHVLEQAFASEGPDAAGYDAFMQEFSDAEIVTFVPTLTLPQTSTWKTNSAANATFAKGVRDYSPL